MIPLRDDVPSRAMPVVTVTLVAANVVAFLYQLSLELGGPVDVRGTPEAAVALVYEFGLVPCRLTGGCRADFPHPVATVFTSMFLHGGLLHIAGNMLYLWIFGNNVEDTLGHLRFLVFYLACGGVAALSQTMVAPVSTVPMIGASGAVSGVLGAYLVLFPYARILTLVIIWFFVRFIYVPAIIMLGLWIVMQVLSGVLTMRGSPVDEAGVAWFAHIGGFVGGIALLFALRPARRRRL